MTTDIELVMEALRKARSHIASPRTTVSPVEAVQAIEEALPHAEAIAEQWPADKLFALLAGREPAIQELIAAARRVVSEARENDGTLLGHSIRSLRTALEKVEER